MKKLIYLIALISIGAFSQNPAVYRNGIDTKLIALDTLTTAQRDAITLKASKGYVIFNADTNSLNVHNGTSWGEVTGGATNLSTTQTPTTVTINSDTGTDATIALGNGVDAGVSINDYTNADKALVGSALQSGDNVSLLTNDSGYLVSADLSNYVQLTGNQTIGGVKTFTSEPRTTGVTYTNATIYSSTIRATNVTGASRLVELPNDSGTFALISDAAYNASTWDGDAIRSPSRNAIRDLIEGLPIGSGNVTKVGTPLSNQIGVWTGDGTIEGIAGFEYDKTTATFDIGQTVGGLAKIESGGLPLFDYDMDNQDLTVSSQNFLVSNATTVNFTQAQGFTVPTGTVGNEAVNFTQLEAKVDDTAYAGTWDGVTTIAPSKNAVYDKIEGLILGAGTGATPIPHVFAGGETSYDFGTTITDSAEFRYGTTTSSLYTLNPTRDYTVSGSVITFLTFTAAANDKIIYIPAVSVPTTYDASETTVSPAVNGNTNVQTVAEDHETRIDALEAVSSSLNMFQSQVSITNPTVGTTSTVLIPAQGAGTVIHLVSLTYNSTAVSGSTGNVSLAAYYATDGSSLIDKPIVLLSGSTAGQGTARLNTVNKWGTSSVAINNDVVVNFEGTTDVLTGTIYVQAIYTVTTNAGF